MLTGDSADELFGGYSIHEKYFNEVSLSNSRIFQYLIKLLIIYFLVSKIIQTQETYHSSQTF